MNRQDFFEGLRLSNVLFPVGGIGTGTISIGGRGQFDSLEIFNRPSKDLKLPFTFFAIKLESDDGNTIAKILEKQLLPPFSSSHGLKYSTGAGLPRFSDAYFKGEYPFGTIYFSDKDIPLNISLEFFNPFIPLDIKNSSLPVAIFKFHLDNPTNRTYKGMITLNLSNPVGIDIDRYLKMKDYGVKASFVPGWGGNLNEFRSGSKLKAIYMSSIKYNNKDYRYGNLTLATTNENVTYQLKWYGEEWFDDLRNFWRTFIEGKKLREESSIDPSPEGKTNTASLGARFELSPGEDYEILFLISWYFPNILIYKDWNPILPGMQKVDLTDRQLIYQNYYTNFFNNSYEVASYTIDNFDYLYSKTKEFHDILFNSSIPRYVTEIISSQLSIIRSNTCFMTKEGLFFGFEGCFDNDGCCPMNCTHVWNYAQGIAFLYPELEKTMRRIDFLYNTLNDGKMLFRTPFPLGIGKSDKIYSQAKAAADGQLGTIIRFYREFNLTGDTTFLKELWPYVKKALNWAIKNWDDNETGVLKGEQHNTYDVEFYGINSMTSTYYLGALKAASKIARFLGDPDAERYEKIYESGIEKLLKTFNGEYFEQKFETAEDKNRKYQYGSGCLSDQIVGEWLSLICGAGKLLPEEITAKTLLSIFRYNWLSDLSNHHNIGRTYALNDEKGLILCTWPKGGKPEYPFPYADEVWPGVEYQVASHLILHGFVEEGLKIVKGVYDRFDGLKRNPWNQQECGNHYVRSLSSWALLIALSGYQYDFFNKRIKFSPIISQSRFRTFFSNGNCWGEYHQKIDRKRRTANVKIKVYFGTLEFKKIELGIGIKEMISICVNGEQVKEQIHIIDTNTLEFENEFSINENEEIELKFSIFQ